MELLSEEWKAANTDRISILDRDMAAEKNVGAIFHPSATINGKTFRGDYSDSNQLFKAICSTIGKDKPEVCRQLNFKDRKSQDERDNVSQGFNKENPDDMKEARK